MVTYKDSGVDIRQGDAAVRQISGYVKSTYSPRVLPASHGAFAGLFQLDYPRGILRRDYKDPILVAATDGVGTKLEIAYRTGIAGTVGIDLVAMCVNDLVVQGAEPLFFLDYVAVGKLRAQQVGEVVKGIADGCRQSGCALLGGETAEMPGFYPAGHYELAGFAVGVVERSRLILGERVAPGDQIIGLPSSGLHSNGYSLVRRIVSNSKARLKSVPAGLDRPLGEELLMPTTIYVKPILSVLRDYRRKRVIRAMAHITGGGLPGNLPRVLRRGVDAVVYRNRWEVPPIFRWLQEEGKVSDAEMFRVFNMGIGMALVVSKHFCDGVLARFERENVPAVRIGEIVRGKAKPKLLMRASDKKRSVSKAVRSRRR
jgi:phosphoribosylformylglycinamidine cyclo-ligase